MAQSIDPILASELQFKIDSFRSAYNLQGISASAYLPNRGVWRGVTGESYAGVPIDPDMGFGIANNTKLLTGVLGLVDTGSDVEDSWDD
ncbi:MAG: hypothetical protein ACKOZY_10605 [Flavobacteriales bacterium]